MTRSPATGPRGALVRAGQLAGEGHLSDALAVLAPWIRSAGAPPALLVAAGRIHLALGQLGAARKVLERAVALAPRAPGPQESLGTVLWRQGHLDDAARLLEKVTRAWPDRLPAWTTLGEVRLRQRRLPHAEAVAAELVRRSPDTHHGLRLLALIALERGRLEDADRFLRSWLDRQPGAPEAQGLLADLLSRARRFDEATALFQAARARAPHDLALCTRHAHHLGRAGDFDGALDLFQHVLHADAGQAVHHANLGIARMWVGQLDEAVHALQTAVACEPHNAGHRWNLSHALLQRGDYERGFAVHEQRVALFGPPPWWNQRWKGESVPKGTPLVLDAAQGLGDAIQFVRFARDAAERGAEVVVRAHPRLLPLFSGAVGVSATLSSSEAPPPRIKRARLLSLPHAVGIRTAADLGHRVPYLRVPPARTEAWAQRLSGPTLRVGIVWQGNPHYALDHLRSPPLKHYLPLAQKAGVSLYSLQKFHGIDQLAAVDRDVHPIIDLGPELDQDVAFLDTAAAMLALDLVLTSDTSIAHLAGALGVETWLVLPFAPDWRWPRTGTHTPWYPTMRLFRQESPGDWTEVFSRVSSALDDRRAPLPCQ